MISSVTGLPGEGKTCFAVQHIILHELMSGKRIIWSNIEWHKKKVLEYCKEYGYTVDPKRLRKIPDEEIPKFWKFCTKNSLIVLDEVAEHFNSHAWQEIGPEAGSWARQHRKLGQETYFVVQDVNHIYKQFRDLIHQEIRIVNMSNKPVFGFFMPKVFIAKWILKGQFKPTRTKTYRFNTKVFDVYNTLATVGGLLETGEEIQVKDNIVKKNGKGKIKVALGEFLSTNWYKVLGGGMIVGLVVLMILAPKLIQKGMGKDQEKAENNETITKERPKTDNTVGLNLLSTRSTGRDRGTPYNIGRYNSPSKRRP
jgi:hypothetical protein